MGDVIRGRPFDSTTAALASAKARQNAADKATKAKHDWEGKVALTDKMVEMLPRKPEEGASFADVCFAGARRVAIEVLLGNVPVRTGSEAASIIRALTEIGRLEMGEATANVEHGSIEERLERLKQMRDSADQRMGELRSVPDVAKPVGA